MGLCNFILLSFSFLLVLNTGSAQLPHIGQLSPGFQTFQAEWAHNNGRFLLSNNSEFAFGFYTALDAQSFVLIIIHIQSAKAVWTANRGLLVKDHDKFVFDKNGDVYLESEKGVVWSTNTNAKEVTSMELLDSGNLVLLGGSNTVLWQSFSHPTDTLLPGQDFLEGMRLKSFPNPNNLFHYLEFRLGDLVLYAGFETPQVYWSISSDNRKTNTSLRGKVHSVSPASNSWNFYDQNRGLLWQFVFSNNTDTNAFWAVILGSDGSISFHNLQKGRSATSEATKIPENSCSTPQPCDPYSVCYADHRCQCLSPLSSRFNCKPPNISRCNDSSKSSFELLYLGEKLDYFALLFVIPSLKSHFNACKEACLGNCSCLALFFENSSGNCFLFDQIGSLKRADEGATGYISYMKVSVDEDTEESKNAKKHVILIVVLVIAALFIIVSILAMGFWYRLKKKNELVYTRESLDEDNFLDSLSLMPARFSYSDLCQVTQNFSAKIGQGGFGSVYLGKLSDGTQIAVKKLEGVGQGEKEFRAEVGIIGSIHHVHLVKLKGFCAEGPHRLLVYEYLGKGSLDKWIFKNQNKEGHSLDWNTRFNIALGTAKGLAYLHEECEVKIVHCDIKPENVLLDEKFTAKVSDFGLAKLMQPEQSFAYTTLRGTRGYLAPEWITNYAISERSDVYSFGLVLLEIIGGRKNYNPEECSEKGNFPYFAFKMLEEGKLKEVFDPKLEFNENDERFVAAIKVALWCIQDDKKLRPPMTKVVQMLEGIFPIPYPPSPSQLCLHSSLLKSSTKEASSSGAIDYWSDVVNDSECRLSGPR